MTTAAARSSCGMAPAAASRTSRSPPFTSSRNEARSPVGRREYSPTDPARTSRTSESGSRSNSPRAESTCGESLRVADQHAGQGEAHSGVGVPGQGRIVGSRGRERPHCPDANAPIERHPRCPRIAARRNAGSSALRRSIRAGKAGSPMLAKAKAAPRQRRSAGACRLSTIASMEPSARRPNCRKGTRCRVAHGGIRVLQERRQGGDALLRGRSDLLDERGGPGTDQRTRVAERTDQ